MECTQEQIALVTGDRADVWQDKDGWGFRIVSPENINQSVFANESVLMSTDVTGFDTRQKAIEGIQDYIEALQRGDPMKFQLVISARQRLFLDAIARNNGESVGQVIRIAIRFYMRSLGIDWPMDIAWGGPRGMPSDDNQVVNGTT
jgi:hypothetical protein